MTNSQSTEDKYYSEFRTAFVSYGISKKDEALINHYLSNLNQRLKKYTSIPELKHIVCSDWAATLEVDSFIIAINFASLTGEEEIEIFNEIYAETDITILATDRFPIRNNFSYFPDFKFTNTTTLDKIMSVTIKENQMFNL